MIKRIIIGIICTLSLTGAFAQARTDAQMLQSADTIKNEAAAGGNTKLRISNNYKYLINSKASLLGTYSNPSWITGLAWSKILSTPTTLSGYGITNAQGALTLTTTGSSGASTLIGNTLNIPQYSGGGGSNPGMNLTRTATKTSSYTAAPGELVITDATSAVISVTLPTAPADKTTIAVKQILVTNPTYYTSITTGGSDVFNRTGGGTTFNLITSSQGAVMQYTSATGIWTVISDDLTLTQLDNRFSKGNLADVGTIINESWTSLSSWTQVGSASWSVSGGQLTANGGTPVSEVLTNYIKNTGYGTSGYTLFEQQADITVGTINSTSWGVAFGFTGQNPQLFTVHAALMLDATNSGKLRAYYNSSTTAGTFDESKGKLAISTGDVVTLKVVSNYNGITISAYNKTTKRGIDFPVYATESVGNPKSNIYQHSIFILGGTHKVNPYAVKVTEKKGADWLFLDDSYGSTGYNPNNAFLRLLQDKVYDNISSYGGPGNRIQDFVAAEVLMLAPKNIVLQAGTNNSSESTGTVTGRITTLMSALTGYTLGTNFYITEIMPRADVDVSGFATAYAGLWSTGVVPAYLAMKDVSGFAMNPEFVSNDNLHPNGYGQEAISGIYFQELPFLKKVLPKYQVGGTKSIFNNPPITFSNNGASSIPNPKNGTLQTYGTPPMLYYTYNGVNNPIGAPGNVSTSGLISTYIPISSGSNSIDYNSNLFYTGGALNLGDGSTAASLFKLSFPTSGGGAEIRTNIGGSLSLSLGFNTQGYFGGTANNISGRSMYVYDYTAGGIISGWGPDGAFTVGPTSSSYGFRVTQAGAATITGLAGSGTRMVTTDASGNLGSAAVPSGTTPPTFNTQSSNYTFVLSDGSTSAPVIVKATSSSASAFTIPPNSSVAYAVGTVLSVVWDGTGTPSFLPGAGVTINPSAGTGNYSFPSNGRYSIVTVLKQATDTWYLFNGVPASGLDTDATDADFTAITNTDKYLPSATLTTNRTITIPTGSNGDYLRLYNNEAGFTWNLAGGSVYLSDGATILSALLANTNYYIKKISGKWRILN